MLYINIQYTTKVNIFTKPIQCRTSCQPDLLYIINNLSSCFTFERTYKYTSPSKLLLILTKKTLVIQLHMHYISSCLHTSHTFRSHCAVKKFPLTQFACATGPRAHILHALKTHRLNREKCPADSTAHAQCFLVHTSFIPLKSVLSHVKNSMTRLRMRKISECIQTPNT